MLFFRCVLLCDLGDLNRLCSSTEVQFVSLCVGQRCMSQASNFVVRLWVYVVVVHVCWFKVFYCQVGDCHYADCVGFRWLSGFSNVDLSESTQFYYHFSAPRCEMNMSGFC